MYKICSNDADKMRAVKFTSSSDFFRLLVLFSAFLIHLSRYFLVAIYLWVAVIIGVNMN